MKVNYDLMLKGTVGYWDFSQDQVDYVLSKNKECQVNVLIDSLGGLLNEGLSISSAFADHGNVHVHYRGFNASAATIASMGAAHVTMDRTAMYLVHKCSTMVFEWNMMNADALRAKIESYTKSANELEKLDACMAQMYARRCKKTDAELLTLMQEERWLNAEEALEWGFIDEIVEAGESVKLKASVASAMANAGMPVPQNISIEADGFFESLSAMLARFAEKITGKAPSQTPAAVAKAPAQAQVEGNNQPQNITTMKKVFNFIALAIACAVAEFEADAEGKFAFDETQMDQIEGALAAAASEKEAHGTALAEKDARIAELEAKLTEQETAIAEKDARIAELSARPADGDAQVLGQGAQQAAAESDDSWANARAMMGK